MPIAPIAQPVSPTQQTGDQQPGPQQAGSQQATNPFSSPASAPDFTVPSNSPYQAPMNSGRLRPLDTKSADIPGIIGVVCGGLSLFFLVIGICISPAWILAVLGSIAGLVTSFFGRQPLKTIGISLNAVAIFLCILLTILVVWFFIAVPF